MKRINFWRTMLFAALAVTAFSSCKEDEPDQTTGMPEITVNGQSNLVVAGELKGGKLAPITVVAKGTWSASTPSDGSWCTVLPATGSTGTSTIVLDLSQASAERTTTVTLSAKGSVAGVPITVKATITVKQNDGGSTVAKTNVAEVRAALKAALAAAKPADGTKVAVPADLAAMTLTGIVVSNAATDNMGNKYLIAVSDPNGVAHSGLTVNGTKFKDLALTPGKVITASLAGAQMLTYKALTQLSLSDAVEIKVDNGEALPATVVTVANLLDYESQYVKVENSQAMDGAFGVAWYVATGNKGNVDFMTKDGAFVVRTSQYASYKTEQVTDKSGYIMGIAGRFEDDKQLSPQSADDVAHLDQARMQAEYTKVTINNLAAGNFEVDGTIVAVHSKGVLVADNAGGKNNYVLSFFNDWTLQTSNPFKDKVNFLANVKGVSKDQYGLWQFTAPTITTSTANAFDNGVAANFDGDAIDAYAKAIIADQASTSYKYVKLSGVTVTIGDGGSGDTAYKTYTLTFPGGMPAGTPVVSIVATYAFDSYFAGVNSGDVIDITGFALGYDTKGNKLNIMTTKVEKNTSTPSLSAAVSSVAFAATGEAQTVAYTAANLASNKVYAKITGADAAAFTVSAAELTSPITVTAAENTGTTAKSATLRIYAAAAVDGAEVVFDEVALSQAAPAGSGGAEGTKGTYTSMAQFISDGGSTANPAGLGESLAGGKPVSGFKLGTGSKVGTFTSTAVGVAGSKKLGFYAIGWSKKPGATLKITVNGGGSASTSQFTLTGGDENGAVGNIPFLALIYDDATDYYVVDLTGLTAASTITFETTVASNGRAVVCGVQLF